MVNFVSEMSKVLKVIVPDHARSGGPKHDLFPKYTVSCYFCLFPDMAMQNVSIDWSLCPTRTGPSPSSLSGGRPLP